MKNWMWSKISSGVTAKHINCIALPPDSKIQVCIGKTKLSGFSLDVF